MSEKRIPVKALREGFFDSEIKPEGSKFYVNTVGELGSWMERLDGGVNPKEGAHLKVAKAVEEKLFLPVNVKKLKDPAVIEREAKKAIADSHKSAPSVNEVTGNKEEILEGEITGDAGLAGADEEVVLTPAQKAAITRSKNAAKASKKAPAKKVKAVTEGLI